MLGARLVQAGPREAEPIAGKAPTVDLTVRAAYDAEFVYFQFRWPTQVPHAIHTVWRYDGKQWVEWGGEKPEATKNEVRKALKKLYGVDAVKVDVVNARGRKRRFMRTFTPGRRYKKAIVTLKTGQTLDIIPK